MAPVRRRQTPTFASRAMPHQCTKLLCISQGLNQDFAPPLPAVGTPHPVELTLLFVSRLCQTNGTGKMLPSDCTCDHSKNYIEIPASIDRNRSCECQRGYTQSQTVERSCERCEIGFFKEDIGIQGCTACDPGHTTLTPGATNKSLECVCMAGSYDRNTHPLLIDCQQCTSLKGDIEGQNCSNLEGITRATLPLHKGYWRASVHSEVIWPCYNPSFCLGGTTNCTDAWCREADRDAGCRPGHTGPYCQNCINTPLHYKSQDGTCVEYENSMCCKPGSCALIRNTWRVISSSSTMLQTRVLRTHT